VKGDRAQAMCVRCGSNVSFNWKPLKAGDVIGDPSNSVGRFG